MYVFHILSGLNCLRKRKLLSRDRSAHTAKRMCPTEHCTTGETPRARTRAKVVISCSTFSNADHCYAGMTIAKCTKTAACSNVSNHLSRTPVARFASGTANHGRPYRNLGS